MNCRLRQQSRHCARHLDFARHERKWGGVLGIADQFKFYPVPVEEIEPPAGIIVAMVERFEPGRDHRAFGFIEVVDHQGHVVERGTLGIGPGGAIAGVKRDLIASAADVDGPAAQLRRPAPALVPAAQLLQQSGGPIGIADGDIDMFEEAGGHIIYPF